MYLSLQLIMDELGYEADINLSDDQNPRFSFVELYSPNADMDRDKLLVCGLSEALSVPDRENLYFLCVRDRMVDDTETPESMLGITVIRRNIDFRELFNRVQRVFVRVNEWIMQMEQSVSANRGIQDLLTLSEPVFKNHITVQDSTFKLLYYTKGIKISDTITNKLIECGYHPPETVQLLQKLRRLEEYERSFELIISRDYATSKYEVVKKIFHSGGRVAIHVVMVCCGRPATDGMVELFEKFLEYIKVYVDRDNGDFGGNNAFKTLALDLIAKNVKSREEARNRAMYTGFPYEGNFRLVVVSFDDKENIPLSRLVLSFAEVFPQASVFSKNRNVLILDMERAEPARFKEVFDRALDSNNFLCGISNRFNCLWDIDIAYEQAVMAINLARKLKHSPGDGENEYQRMFCPFCDYWIYHLLSEGIEAAPVVYSNSFLIQAVEKLRDYDALHHTNTLSLLRVYLENERKATVVSSILHMHRNTVLYHVGKIENILGVSLDDPEVRLKLQLAFRAENFRRGIFTRDN